MRSLLLLTSPATHSPAALESALASGADVLVIDVADLAEDALQTACAFIHLARGRADRPRLFARIPALDSPLAIGRLDPLLGAGTEGIVLPCAGNGQDVTHLDARIAVEEAVHAIDHGSVKIIAEAAGTAKAVLGLASFRGASQRLIGLIWSPHRLARDLGGIDVATADGSLRPAFNWTCGQFIVAAHAAGVAAIIDGTHDWPGDARTTRFRAAFEIGFTAGLASNTEEIADITAPAARPPG